MSTNTQVALLELYRETIDAKLNPTPPQSEVEITQPEIEEFLAGEDCPWVLHHAPRASDRAGI